MSKFEKRPTQYKRAREASGLSLSQASKLMGVELRELAHIENGDKSPAVWIQSAMMNAYDVSYKYLLTGKPETLMDYRADGTADETIDEIFKKFKGLTNDR